MRPPTFERRLLALAERASGLNALVLAWPDDRLVAADPSGQLHSDERMRRRLALVRAEAVALDTPVIHALGTAGDGWSAYCDARRRERPILLMHSGGAPPLDDRAWLAAETVFDGLAALSPESTEESAARRLKTILSGIESMAQIGIWQVDLESGRVTWSDEACRIHGLEPGSDEPTLDGLVAFFPEEVRGLVRNSIDKAVEERSSFSFVLPFRPAHGQLRTVRCIGEVVSAEGLSDTLCGIVQDVTEQREAELRLWWSANHDALTGLPNRSLWQDRLDEALELARSEGQCVGLILADLDNFKAINDVYGHEAGDTVLKRVAERLSEHTRQGDTLARLGGDEFAVIVSDLTHPGELDGALKRLVTAADIDVDYRGRRIPVKMSMGAAVFPRDGDNDRELYRNADLALFRSKAEPCRRGTLYSRRYGEEGAGRESRVHEIRSAILEDAIAARYRPVVDLATGVIHSFEALAYRRNADGPADAGAFVPGREDGELSTLLGIGLVKQMAADWRRLRDELGRVVPLRVDAGPSRLQNYSFLDALCALIDDGTLCGETLVLAVRQDPTAALGRHVRPAFVRLVERGVVVAFDSLPAGFSALMEPTGLNVRQVKVDCRTLRGHSESGGRAIAWPVLCGMIDACRVGGLELIASGVATADDLRAARAMGFTLAEGDHLGAPMAFDMAMAELTAAPALVPVRAALL